MGLRDFEVDGQHYRYEYDALEGKPHINVRGDGAVGIDARMDCIEPVKLPYVLARERSNGQQSALIPLNWLTYRDFGYDAGPGYGTYFTQLLKWICSNYQEPRTGVWVGPTVPDAQGYVIITIYDTHEVNGEGMPRYATGTFRIWTNEYRFAVYDYNYSELYTP